MFRPLVSVVATLLISTATTVTATEPSSSPALPAGLSAWTGVSWSQVGALPKGVDVSTLTAWGDGYVVVGADQPDRADRQQGGVWHSTDLSTWSRVVTTGDPDGATALTTLLTLPTGLLALGSAQPAACVGPVETPCDAPSVIAWTSTDGIAWDELTGSGALGAGTITEVATGPDQVLAVGDQGWSVPAIWRSADGLRWDVEALPTDTFGDAHLFGVTSFAGGWVAVGMTGGKEPVCCDATWMVDETQPAAWWSPDGVDWQPAALDVGASEWGARLGSVFAAPDGLVAVDDGDPVADKTTAGQPQLWTSADGHAWTPASVDPDTAFRPIASDGTAILGRSTHGDLAVSTDGTTWRTLDAQGTAPGATTPMEWGYMQPAWLVPDGVLAVGLNEQGGPTRRLLLATPVTAAP